MIYYYLISTLKIEKGENNDNKQEDLYMTEGNKILGQSEDDFKEYIHRILYPDVTYKPRKKDYDLPENLNPKLCKKCKGHCCKKCGCHFSPDDFDFKKVDDENGPRDSNEVIFDILKKEIEKGYIVIEYVPSEAILSDTDGILLRVRNRKEGLVGDWNRSPCILLTDKGCKLDYEDRPSGGRLLRPILNKKTKKFTCIQHYDIDDCCREWLPFKEVLSQLYNYFKEFDESFPCSI